MNYVCYKRQRLHIYKNRNIHVHIYSQTLKMIISRIVHYYCFLFQNGYRSYVLSESN